jgi:hypothetical protein
MSGLLQPLSLSFFFFFCRFGRLADVYESKIFFLRSEEKANMNQLYYSTGLDSFLIHFEWDGI